MRLPEERRGPGADAGLPLMAGLEIVLNLLAPNEQNRFFEASGTRHTLCFWSGVCHRFRPARGWTNGRIVAMHIEAPGASYFWCRADRNGFGIGRGFRTRISGLPNPGNLAHRHSSRPALERGHDPPHYGREAQKVARKVGMR